MMRAFPLLFFFGAAALHAQETVSGFTLRATASVESLYDGQMAQPLRSGSPVDGGLRLMLYPTWKLSRHWALTGAFQTYSRPYFVEQLGTQGHGMKGDLLQASLSWSQFWQDGSIVVRAGQMLSAFGSFPLRYDDAVNPLIDVPPQYGYYYKPVSDLGFAGVETDVTFRKLDARAQFANSSPANRLSVFDKDQYGAWAAGAGYTVVQGFRVGVSAYRGPYLDEDYPYYVEGESEPRSLPATAVGTDAQWGLGHWSIQGEVQHFTFDYHAIPVFRETAAYIEAKRTLSPRWYLAARTAYLWNSVKTNSGQYEAVAGFRPTNRSLIKVGYELAQVPDTPSLNRIFAIQFVTTFRLM